MKLLSTVKGIVIGLFFMAGFYFLTSIFNQNYNPLYWDSGSIALLAIFIYLVYTATYNYICKK